eukprot:TRINITY_DN93_c0_g1_i1.p1 TRINITY_DN93_c0_g1~~TRINITY_DN93_c0_g1_i1.p1  ORF type:complete len:425 (-),score=144.35 TRINITY_DN93_c0_g1_i1:59-1333(-)
MTKFEVVVFGVTGYTGKLVAEVIAKKIQQQTDPLAPKNASSVALAGRDLNKLQQLADALASKYPGIGTFGIIQADSGDVKSIEEMVKQTKVVMDLAGPYAKYGTPVVEACVRHGVHCCDLTGEAYWNRFIIDQFDEQAKKNESLIVSFCGMDSIPSDLGTLYLVDHVRQKYGVGVGSVQYVIKTTGASMSGGTFASGLEMGDLAKSTDVLDEYLLNPRDDPKFAPQTKPRKQEQRKRLFYSEDAKTWVAEFFMSIVNTRVVRRSWRLYEGSDHSYGQNFSYATEGLHCFFSPLAFIVAFFMYLLEILAVYKPVRNLLKQVVPKSGEGPSDWALKHTKTNIRLYGEIDDPKTSGNKKKKVVVEVNGGEMGYKGTSEMFTECGLLLAGGKTRVKGGVVTPAYAFGVDLAHRISNNTSISFRAAELS